MLSSKTPVLSIILPAYNAEKYIRQAIDSILNQTYRNFELIIADDGSSDRTKNIIDSYSDPRIIISHNKSNVGKVLTVNRLLSLSNGEFVTVHDADDFSHPLRFEKQLDFLLSNPEFVLCGSDFFQGGKNENFNDIIRMPQNYSEIRKNYLLESQVHGPTAIFRKEILNYIGGLYRGSELLRPGEDIDFISRVIEKHKVTNYPTPLYYYRNIPTSMTKSGFSFLRFEIMQLMLFLAEERRLTGYDSLSEGGSANLNDYLKELEIPYKKDKSLKNRKSAELNMYYKFYWNAINESIQAIIKAPLKLKNYRTLQYCLRITLFD